DERHPRLWLNDRHPVLRGLGLSVKNLLGVLFVLAGIAMLVLPGQGLLTMLIGLSFLDFPGKRDQERKIISVPMVLQTINRLREHNRCRDALRHVNELLQPLLKAGRLHVISVASKTRIAPSDVLRIAPAFPPPTQRADVTVHEPRRRQRVRKSILIKLRVS